MTCDTPSNDIIVYRGTTEPNTWNFYLSDGVTPRVFPNGAHVRLTIKWASDGFTLDSDTSDELALTLGSDGPPIVGAQLVWTPTPARSRSVPLGPNIAQYELEYWYGADVQLPLMSWENPTYVTGAGDLNDD